MKWTLLILSLLLVHMVAADASATFASSALVFLVQINDTNPSVLTPVVANGTDILMSMPVIYNGSGTFNVTVGKPSAFLNGFGWTLNESGVLKNVTEQGDNLRWEVNFSRPGAVLTYSVPPPALTVDFVNAGLLSYTQQVRVGGPNPFTNVSASTLIDSSYSGFQLFEEVNATFIDRTAVYSLLIAGTNASWSGFGLPVGTFQLRGSKAPFTSGGGGGGGGGSSYIPQTPEKEQGFNISTNWLDIELERNTSQRVDLVVSSPIAQNLSIRSSSPWIRVPRQVLLAPGDTNITITIFAGEVGEHDLGLTLIAGVTVRTVTVRLTVTEVPPPAPPEPPGENRTAGILLQLSLPEIGKESVIPLLVGILIVLAMIIFIMRETLRTREYRHAKEIEIPPQPEGVKSKRPKHRRRGRQRRRK